MDLGLRGKVALVSGASAGMGLATARALAAAAAAIGDAGGDVSHVSADMATKAGVEKAVQATEQAFAAPPGIAIGNITPTRRFGFDDASDEDFRAAGDVMSHVYLARAVLPSMKEAGWGRVLSISTVAVKEPHRHRFATLDRPRGLRIELPSLLRHGYSS